MEISSSPYLIDPVDFGLSNDLKNAQRLHEIQQWPSRKLKPYKNKALTEYTKEPGNSFIIATYQSARGERIGYLVQIKREKLAALPHDSCYQAEVWRKVGYPLIPMGITRYVFNRILLKRYRYVVSDRSESADGKRFWLERMAEAYEAGHRVGIMIDNEIEWKGEDTLYEVWENRVDEEAWGQTNTHFDTRLIIGRK